MTDLQLRDVFFRKLHVELALKNDMGEYEKFEANDPKKTYEYLVKCVNCRIRQQDQKRNL